MQSIPRNKIDPKLMKEGGTVVAEVSDGEIISMRKLPEITVSEIRELLKTVEVLAVRPAQAKERDLMIAPALFQKMIADRSQGLITIEICMQGVPVTVTQDGDSFNYNLKDSK